MIFDFKLLDNCQFIVFNLKIIFVTSYEFRYADLCYKNKIDSCLIATVYKIWVICCLVTFLGAILSYYLLVTLNHIK